MDFAKNLLGKYGWKEGKTNKTDEIANKTTHFIT